LKKLREKKGRETSYRVAREIEIEAAKGTENLMPLFIECVENDITLGEICNTLYAVCGASMWRKGFSRFYRSCFTP
jgi:methylmalonyl-CoA mutase N-terminal domain/subunit